MSLETIASGLEFVPKLIKLRPWEPATKFVGDHSLVAPPAPFTREQAFACAAFFDSGFVHPDPADLGSVFAICSGSSMYVSALALSDPMTKPAGNEIRHIVGNIGKRGISLLIAPHQPAIRPLSLDFRSVEHAAYDFQRKTASKTRLYTCLLLGL